MFDCMESIELEVSCSLTLFLSLARSLSLSLSTSCDVWILGKRSGTLLEHTLSLCLSQTRKVAAIQMFDCMESIELQVSQREGPSTFFAPRPYTFFVTLVTGPRRSLILKLSDTRVYEPHIRARPGTTAHFCKVPPEIDAVWGAQERLGRDISVLRLDSLAQTAGGGGALPLGYSQVLFAARAALDAAIARKVASLSFGLTEVRLPGKGN